ncbi:MAG: DNA polymerase III subunit alpha [Chloroflexi bacterium]|nr:DNA polymerase III subunit alpha [Chloroflexota bacterium]
MSILDPATFTHLRVHSRASLLRSAASVDDLVQRAAADGMKALALSDTQALYNVVRFDRACHEAGLQPIIGMTIGLAADDDLGNGRPGNESFLGQLVLLAANPQGYQSLCRLSACLQAHPDREPRLQTGLSWDDLRANQDGLICIEAGLSGWLARHWLAGQRQTAAHYAGRLAAIFIDRCYVGLELHRREDAALAHDLIQLGDRFGMPPIVAQPVTHLAAEDADLLPLLAAIERNGRLADIHDDLLPAHWLNLDEIADRFAAFPQAIANVATVIQQCKPALPDGRTIWPALDLPAEQTVEETLNTQTRAALAERKPHFVNQSDYESRLEKELDAIISQGFAPLFLLVADIVRFARQEEIPVSTRGSVANSLVAYLLGITTVDPVEQGLLFERFLNPARANLPDIDLDFCSRRRDEVLNYVRRRYGEDRVAMVGTMNTLQPKSAIRATAKAYGLPEKQIKRLSALAPRRWHPDPRRRELPDIAEILVQLEDETEKQALRQAFRLVGQPDHLSLHPGGIVITPGPLTDYVPVQWAAKGFLTTQYDYRDVEKIGLPKIDLLGIRALTVLADTAVSIQTHHDPNFRLADIPLDDPATGALLARGETIGVFQCESSGAQRTLRQLKARRVRDLAVANAFFKPGPATGGMAQSFVRRYRGEEKVSYLHPSLKPILAPTQGVLLFQEQALRIAVEIAGLSWAQADHLRRGMSKFQAKEMAAMRLAFVMGCQRPASSDDRRPFTPQQAETLWEQILAFAGYGFNQGHAAAYADVSYRSAYLKTHYPVEFLRARLMDRGGFHHPAIYIAEARRLGFTVRPPHVNFSERKVTLTHEQGSGWSGGQGGNPVPILWLGLGQVRHLRRKSMRRIAAERPYTNLRDLLTRVPLQTKEINHLIQCGALESLGESRAALLMEAETIGRAGNARQMAFDFGERTAVPPETAVQRFEWEMHILGMPISVTPLELSQMASGQSIRELSQTAGRRVTVTGYRLSGWTGGKGWFLCDGDSFIIAQSKERPKAWEMVGVNGRYRSDEWGGGWFQVE